MSAINWGRLIVLSVLWGGSFLFVEIALAGLPPLSIVGLRVLLGAALLAGLLAATGRPFPKGRSVWRDLLVMGLFNNAIPFSLFAVAQGGITGSLAAVLNATTPLFTLLVARVVVGEAVTLPHLAGLAAGLAGVAVVTGGGAGAPWAVGLCLSAALSYGVAGVWGRRFGQAGLAPVATAFGQLAASSMIILPVCLMVDRPWTLDAPGWPVVGAVAGIALLSTAWAYQIYFRLLAAAGPVNLLLVTFLIPVSAALMGAIWLSEAISGPQVAGFGCIACGLALIDGRVLRLFRAASARNSR